jgi:hypothetical protein
MLIIIIIIIFINYNFVLDVMYITPHLHVVKDSWEFKIKFNKILIKKISNLKTFKLWILF